MAQNLSVSINKIVASLVKNLSPRNKDIISRRFGLKNGKKETLDSIGKSYGITRERVRQIEEFILKQLAGSAKNSSEAEEYVSLANRIIDGAGGVIKESELFRNFSGHEKESSVNASLVLLLSFGTAPLRISESDGLRIFWALDERRLAAFKNAAASVENILAANKKPVAEAAFVSMVKNVTGFDGGELSSVHLDTLLSISKNIGRNIYDEVGLLNCAEIKPRGVKDKAYLILRKANIPKHFADIAKSINVAGFFGKKANVQTVHNELIGDKRFVLVGRGIYALKSWGFQPGVVSDVVKEVLKQAGRPLLVEDIIEAVLAKREVKRNTVVANLQNKSMFRKVGRGLYELVE